MNLKTLLATAAIVAFSVPAFAQDTTASTTGQEGAKPGPTQAEMTMFEANADIYSGFFMDDTWTTMRSEEEIATGFGSLTADQQAAVRADCETLNADQTSYGEGTIAFCASIGAL